MAFPREFRSGRASQIQFCRSDATIDELLFKLKLDGIVMPGAARLPIGTVPEQGPVTAVRHDMIYHCSSSPDTDGKAADAPWTAPKEFSRGPFPTPIVAAIMGIEPVAI